MKIRTIHGGNFFRLRRLGTLLTLLGGMTLPGNGVGAAPLPTAADDLQRLMTSLFGGATISGSYLAGRHALRQRDFEQAARFMDRALQLDPAAPGVVMHALALHVYTGQWVKAEALARRIVRGQSRHRIARLVLGIAQVRQGRFARARAHFVKAAHTPIGILSGGMLAAWTWMAEQNLPEALESLDILDSYDAFAGFRHYHAALMADLAGQTKRAEALYRKAHEAARGSMRVAYAYGNFLRRQGQPMKAIALYRAFLRQAPGNAIIEAALEQTRRAPEERPAPMVGSVRDGMAEALFSLTSALLDERSLNEALLHARMTLALRPNLHVAWVLLGEIEENMGRKEQALSAYRKVPRGHALHLDAQIRSARLLRALQRREESLELLRELTREHAADARPWLALGNALRMDKRWREAVEAYTEALKRFARIRRGDWVVFYYRGIAHERAGEWHKAEADFRKALKLNPDQPSVLNYLGYSLVDRGEKLHEALKMVRRAVQARPNDGYIIDSLGWAYFRLGRYEDAVRELERAIELRPDDPVINDHLGDAYWMVGRRLEARFQWQHALDADPEPELREQLERKLRAGLPAIERGDKSGKDKARADGESHESGAARAVDGNRG